MEDDLKYRYELKYTLDKYDLEELYLWIAQFNTAGFRKAYDSRQINNIYYDSTNMTAYFEAESGVAQRTKARIRWYNDFNIITNPVLELKRKDNNLGYKDYFKFTKEDIKSFDDLYDVNGLIKKVSNEFKPYFMKYNKPAILNTYHREYYENKDGIRLTIDTDMKYKKLYHQNFIPCENYAILEIKYPKRLHEKALRLFDEFPFTLSKNSKFMNAMDLL